jgi:tRNA (cmo5U34)-methyltransferase
MPADESPLTDRLFADRNGAVEAFRFDEKVASVFPDMVTRSVPGYLQILDGLTLLARRVVMPGTRVYDLGCSLGAATLAAMRGIEAAEVRITAVDNSSAMIKRAGDRLSGFRHGAQVEVVLADMNDVPIEGASLVLLNYTLQFVPVSSREHLCRRICDGLLPGGVLVLSEKVLPDDAVAKHWLTELHEDFKRTQGYSELEIAQKRTALEGVLIAESVDVHRTRLQRVGFDSVFIWFQHYQFVSLLAVKRGSTDVAPPGVVGWNGE